ncbi:hypothetical protein HOK51_04800 [Candidatus Woesearchaeota archaeon]|jgi:hypothetical protein|nr:hypothetical protein [Candidatus Woesearchaeota archaeon]MBT6519144.1 hypothetical protein [Candidatus Woesearchaeota archaeon]MBT7367777.1 hypothetical protein [Candidatus Woesearchaeota archaeon]
MKLKKDPYLKFKEMNHDPQVLEYAIDEIKKPRFRDHAEDYFKSYFQGFGLDYKQDKDICKFIPVIEQEITRQNEIRFEKTIDDALSTESLRTMINEGTNLWTGDLDKLTSFIKPIRTAYLDLYKIICQEKDGLVYLDEKIFYEKLGSKVRIGLYGGSNSSNWQNSPDSDAKYTGFEIVISEINKIFYTKRVCSVKLASDNKTKGLNDREFKTIEKFIVDTKSRIKGWVEYGDLQLSYIPQIIKLPKKVLEFRKVRQKEIESKIGKMLIVLNEDKNETI